MEGNRYFCECCGISRGDISKEEIQEQIKRHGEYICKNCEDRLEGIVEAQKTGETIYYETVDGCFELLISDGVTYYLNDYDGIVKNPERDSFLGFGGRTYIIQIPGDFCKGVEDRVVFTNSLWGAFRIPKSYKGKIKDNAEVTYIRNNLIKDLKEQLGRYDYWG